MERRTKNADIHKRHVAGALIWYHCWPAIRIWFTLVHISQGLEWEFWIALSFCAESVTTIWTLRWFCLTPQFFSKPKKQRQDEKPFIEALAVWKSVSNQKSPKEIEATHGLPRNSFLAYVKWKDEPEPELPQTIRKPQIKLQKQIIFDGGEAA